MAEQKIIAKADIQNLWDFSENVDQSKIDAAILRAQQTDLESLLGAAMYHDFVEDYNGLTFDTPAYQTLYDGGEYTYKAQTIYFRGVKALLSVYAYIHLVDIIRINVVRSGQVYKVAEESEFLEDFQSRADNRKAKSDAIRLEKDVLQYLETNLSTYPLFRYREYKDVKTSYNFYKL